MEYIIVCLLTIVLEIGLVCLFQKREPEYSLNGKRYRILLVVGNVAIMGVAVFLEMQGILPAIWYFGICTYLFCLSIYDIKFRELPDWFHLIPLLLYAYLFIRKGLPFTVMSGLLMALIVGVILLVVFLIRRDAIGLGDIKTMIVCSFYVAGMMPGIMIKGMLVAFLFSLVLLILKKVNTKSGIPFIPFLFLGALFM